MVIWIIGLSAAGKTTLGKLVYAELKRQRPATVFLDGDSIREIMGNDLGHSLADRKRNAERICRLCLHLDRQDITVVCSILSIFEESHRWNREHYQSYFEIYVEAGMPTLLKRQRNQLYDRAARNELKDVVGVDIPFTPPERPDLVINNDGPLEELEGKVESILRALPHP